MGLRLGYRKREQQKKHQGLFLRVPLAIALLSAASGCGLSGSSSNTQTHGGGGEVRQQKLVTDVNVNDARKIAKPVSSSEGFRTDTPETSIGSDSGRALPPPGVVSQASNSFAPKGLKVGSLFNESLRDEDDRFDRLEDSVQDIHDYVAGISPSIDRLVAIEADIQDLVGQLEVLLSEDPQPAAGEPTPMAQKTVAPVAKAQKTVSKPPLSITPIKNNFGPKAIARIRASSSAAKTRVVLDLSEKMPFSYDLDNEIGVLTLVFPEAQSSSVSASSLPKSKLFKEVTATPQDGGGYVIALALSRDVTVINEGKIGVTSANPMYRVYLDLK